MEKDIIIYGKEDCSNCKLVKKILEEKNIKYTYNDDLKTLMKVGSQTRIMSAPIIQVKDKFFKFSDLNKSLEEIEALKIKNYKNSIVISKKNKRNIENER